MPAPQTLPPAPVLPLAIAVLLLWHLALAADYANAKLALVPGLPELTAQMALPQLWAVVGWGLAVWLGLLAALFLLWRDDAAVLLLFAAAVGALLAVIGDVISGASAPIWGLPRALVLVPLATMPLIGWLYTRARHASGHLT